MIEVIKKAKELLDNKTVGVVIGYGEGSDGKARAIFVRNSQDADKFIFDQRCKQNLAVYLNKHEVRHFGKMGILAPLPVMRAILQIASEAQIKESDFVAIGITPDGHYVELPDFKAIENYISSLHSELLTDEEMQEIAKMDAMTMDERWAFWQEEFSKCIKCYACRAACPMCYCTRCIVEVNQPQMVDVPSHKLGNLEWHINHAMHLAGRCVNCGDCARACPVNIPLNLFTKKLISEIKEEFGATAGTSASSDSVLSTYKPNDKENFII
ncbi:MAG: 4Fe-4S dicluster domain-containing protein [Bacteroidota bacterium]|nr:4Fe-4S dicluster domain-containing protein [Bacteroidota bacterium]